MDDSWRMRMGTPALSARRSTHHRTRHFVYAHSHSHSDSLRADDFADVFGGPPRTVVSRNLSGDFSNYASFYEEIFRQPDAAAPANKSGRSLRAFNIPAKSDDFYSDIFGNDQEDRIRKSRAPSSKGKSNSSSVLSSDDLSPRRPAISDDVALYSFASKLRPINVPCRWNSSTMKPAEDPNPKNKAAGGGGFVYNSPSNSWSENQYMDSGHKSSYQGFSSQRVTSPDIINVEPNSYRSLKVSASDFDLNSSNSSAVSSCHWEGKAEFPGGAAGDGNDDRSMQDQEEDDDDEDDDVMSSYVIEINSDSYREGNDEAIDEAIAWAKEKFHQQSPQVKKQPSAVIPERPKECQFLGQQINGHNSVQLLEDEELQKWTREAKQQSEDDIELKVLDKQVELWSSGKESNIRLLLSSLHQILWADSGWNVVPLTNLIESSHVKKAYQKAQLCLHPDKLQQRGATLPQKYVAQKVFAILQDAWAAFVTQDVLLIR